MPVVRIEARFLNTTVRHDEDDLPLHLIPGAELDQLLHSVQVVLGGHEQAEDVPPGVRVHPHLASQIQQLGADLLLPGVRLPSLLLRVCALEVSGEGRANYPPPSFALGLGLVELCHSLPYSAIYTCIRSL